MDTKLSELVHISKMFQTLKCCAGVIYKCRDNKNTVLYVTDKEETFLLPRLDCFVIKMTEDCFNFTLL